MGSFKRPSLSGSHRWMIAGVGLTACAVVAVGIFLLPLTERGTAAPLGTTPEARADEPSTPPSEVPVQADPQTGNDAPSPWKKAGNGAAPAQTPTPVKPAPAASSTWEPRGNNVPAVPAPIAPAVRQAAKDPASDSQWRPRGQQDSSGSQDVKPSTRTEPVPYPAPAAPNVSAAPKNDDFQTPTRTRPIPSNGNPPVLQAGGAGQSADNGSGWVKRGSKPMTDQAIQQAGNRDDGTSESKGPELTPPGRDYPVSPDAGRPSQPIPQNIAPPVQNQAPTASANNGSLPPVPSKSNWGSPTNPGTPKPLDPKLSGADDPATPIKGGADDELLPIKPKKDGPDVRPGDSQGSGIRPPTETQPDEPAPKSTTPPLINKPRGDDDRDLGAPKKGDPKDDDATQRKDELLGSARNAASARKYDEALRSYEEYFKAFPKDSEIEKVRREYAFVLFSAGKLREATKLFQELLAQQRPTDTDISMRLALADVAVTLGEFNLAIHELKKALEAVPRDPEASVRLARTYIYNEDFPMALEVYDLNLSKLRPSDEKTPKQMGDLLIEMDRANDALPFLNAKLEAEPDDAELLASKVKAYVRMADRPKAMDALAVLNGKAPGAITTRQLLGEYLADTGEFDMAVGIFQQILQIKPGDQKAMITLAKTFIRLYKPQPARELLFTVKVTPFSDLDHFLQLTRGEYHILIGEWLQAKDLFKRMLHQNQFDYEIRYANGALQELMGEFEKAKAEYAKIPPSNKFYRRARIGIVSVLTKQRLFVQALEQAKANIAEKPWDGNFMARYILTMDKAGLYDDAIGAATGFLNANLRNDPALLPVRLALGRVLIDAKKYAQAVGEYRAILERPSGRIVQTYYGLAKALEALNEKEKAVQSMSAITSLVGGDTRARLLLADLNANDFDDQSTLEMAQKAVEFDKDNLAALVRLADAQLRVAGTSGDGKDVKATVDKILAQSKTNTRGRLDLARVLGIEKNYRGAIREYDPIVSIDQDFLVPRRERARMFYAANDFAGGEAAFQEILAHKADDVMRSDLMDMAGNDPRADSPLKAYASTKSITGKELQTPEEIIKMTGGDPDLQTNLQRLFYDYQARANEQAMVDKEAEYYRKNWLKYTTIGNAAQLAEIEPGNTSNLFNWSQALANVQRTHPELQVLGTNLGIDPGNRSATIESARAAAELRPQIDLTFLYSAENGRDGLADIARYRYTTQFLYPYGDEDQFLRAAFSRVDYIPADKNQLKGNILTIGGQDKFWDGHALIFGTANVEEFPDRLKDKVTGELGVRVDWTDQLRTRTSIFLENVVENGESLNQNIYRYGAQLGADYQLDRRTIFSGLLTAGHYKDDDNWAELYTRAAYTVCFSPCELKLALVGDFLTYSDPSTINNFGGVPLAGTIHPYFAPSFYAYYEGRIEWKHWLSRDTFIHSNQCYYGLQYAIGWDNSFNNYNNFRAFANYDVNYYVSLGFDANLTLSQFYNAGGVFAYAFFRFP